MRRPHRLPRVTVPKTGEAYRRPFVWSTAVHALLIVALLWQGDRLLDRGPAAGDPGPTGGGGGGGGPRVTYVALQPPPSPATTATRPVEVPVTPQPVPLPVPEVREIPTRLRPIAPPTVIRATTIVRRLGQGPGTGGGPGAGTGSGGGIGSGRGTGIGAGVGPGSGGQGGDVFPPTVRYTFLPPLPRPSALQGKTFHVRFVVDIEGRVVEVGVEPDMRDAGYRRKFLDVMRRFRFRPATLADGTSVTGETVLSFTL